MTQTLFLDTVKNSCFKNFHIQEDGRCYSSECLMNESKEIKELIKLRGCKCFNMLYPIVEDREKN